MARVVVGGVIVCVMIVATDVVAGILSIKAGLITQNKRDSGCKGAESDHHDHEEAFKLGLAAAALQAVAHVVANLLGGFMCICFTEELERSTAIRQLWFASLIFSWIVMAVGFPMLITGILENSKSSSSSSCRMLHYNFLVIGGVLCFLHALLLCIALYVSATFSIRHESSAS